MPIYNGERTLARTLESLVDQGEGLQILAVDQASSDSSKMILEAYRGRLNLRVIDAWGNRNWMQNSNLGLSLADAPLCTMLHQDDVWQPRRGEYLKRMSVEYPNAAMWVHSSWFISQEDRVVGRFSPPFGDRECLISSEIVLFNLLVQNTFALPSVMFSRQAAIEVGGLDETLWYSADWDLWLKLARIGPAAWLPLELTGFRLHADSLTLSGSRDLKDFRKQLVTVMERHIGAVPTDKAERIRLLANASAELNVGLAGYYHGEHSEIWGALLKLGTLGPRGLIEFAKRTQITARILSRVRARIWH